MCRDLVGEGGIHAGDRLVEEDDARIGHQGAPELEELLLPAGQGGGGIVGHASEIQAAGDGGRALAQLRLAPAHRGGPRDGLPERLAGLAGAVEHEVFDDGQPRESSGDLKGAHEAAPGDPVRGLPGDVAPVEDDAARLGRDEAGDAVEQRGLARAIGTDEAGDGALLHVEVHAVEGVNAVEAAGQRAHLEEGHGPRGRIPYPAVGVRYTPAPGARRHTHRPKESCHEVIPHRVGPRGGHRRGPPRFRGTRPTPAAFVSLRGALRPDETEQTARDRAGGSRASADNVRLALVVALGSVVLLATVPGAFALGKSPPPTSSQPAPTAPATPVAPAATPPTKAAGAPVPAQPVAGAIPAPDIPLEADKLITVLRSLEQRVGPSPTLLAIEGGLPAMAQRISDAQIETKGQLSTASSQTELTNLSDLWAGLEGDLKVWADQLRVRATDVGTVIDQLEELTDTWTRTREEARRTQAPPALIKRVDEALAAIAAVRKSATARRVTLLTLQVKIGEQLAAAQEASARIAQEASAELSTLFRPDRPPVWRAWREAPPLSDLPGLVRDSAAPQLAVLARFAADRSRRAGLHVVFFLALVAFAVTARRQARAWAAAGTVDPMLRVLDYPVAVALIVGLILSDWAYVRPPMIAVNVIGIALLVPVVRILRRVTEPGTTAVVWVAAAFFVLNRPRDIALLSAPVAEQAVVLLLGVGGVAAILWLRKRQGLVLGSYKVPEPLVWLGVVTFAVSSLFGAVGYMRLSRLLSGGILRSAYLALALYAGLVVALGVFAYLFRVWL